MHLFLQDYFEQEARYALPGSPVADARPSSSSGSSSSVSGPASSCSTSTPVEGAAQTKSVEQPGPVAAEVVPEQEGSAQGSDGQQGGASSSRSVKGIYRWGATSVTQLTCSS